jgi:hypothetical protein
MPRPLLRSVGLQIQSYCCGFFKLLYPRSGVGGGLVEASRNFAYSFGKLKVNGVKS